MTHSQQLGDVDVASEIIRAAIKDGVAIHVSSYVDLLIDQFETKFRRSITINTARQLVWRGLAGLSTDELRWLYSQTFETGQPPEFFSHTELLNEWLRAELTYTGH
jgi:hypothetical protein